MFTGIIESIGKVKGFQKSEQQFKLEIEDEFIVKNSQRGDSICVNGVCLTIKEKSNSSFTADVMPETVKKSMLSQLKLADQVNLERALTTNKLMGGHLVQGHVDGIGKITGITKEPDHWLIEIKTDQDIIKYMVCKGSIAVNGVSLTLVNVGQNSFSVSIIPTTLEDTVIRNLKLNDAVNIEVDMIGKYVYHYVNKTDTVQGLTKEFLFNHGF